MSEDRLDLQALRAQLYDAMKDTQVWGTCDPSAAARARPGTTQSAAPRWISDRRQFLDQHHRIDMLVREVAACARPCPAAIAGERSRKALRRT